MPYMIRLKSGDEEAGQVGPYKSRRAAAADAKTLVRMHIGQGFKISEVGACGKSTDAKKRFLPTAYVGQTANKPVFTAQIVKLVGKKAQAADKGFQVEYNPRRKTTRNRALSCGKTTTAPRRKKACGTAKKKTKANPLVSFRTASGKTISFDAKKR